MRADRKLPLAGALPLAERHVGASAPCVLLWVAVYGPTKEVNSHGWAAHPPLHDAPIST